MGSCDSINVTQEISLYCVLHFQEQPSACNSRSFKSDLKSNLTKRYTTHTWPEAQKQIATALFSRSRQLKKKFPAQDNFY